MTKFELKMLRFYLYVKFERDFIQVFESDYANQQYHSLLKNILDSNYTSNEFPRLICFLLN